MVSLEKVGVSRLFFSNVCGKSVTRNRPLSLNDGNIEVDKNGCGDF
mgnify:CR=1 FL=1